MSTMLPILRAAFTATAAIAACSGAAAASADAALDRALLELRQPGPERGAWVNPLMPHGTGRVAAESADRILAATLRVYTRAVLDRGGWINPWVTERHYESGHALLAAQPGSGVTSRAAALGLAAAPQGPGRAGPAVTAAKAGTAPLHAPGAFAADVADTAAWRGRLADACLDLAAHLRDQAALSGTTVAARGR